ncbi:hypothetical protein BVJ60_16140 [Vibrio cholerae]|uniref:hypothetical protein n=2 Tax=Vibrio cholerae TaxID=666 RepID=UPI001A9FCF91|nr:hypothetical protein [Vibrio cholerae]MBO1386295.1 hypothetical protein [Vibrio cholerae]WOQ88824.1 hypothetical protein R4535_06890 [Vibrio cholerae]
MNIKLSRIALGLMASVSFSALANNVVSGSAVIAEADIVVNADSNLSLTIAPIAGLTVSDLKKGQTKVANINVTSSDFMSNLAVRMVNANTQFPYCTVAVGTYNSNNTATFCLGDLKFTAFESNGFIYYPVSHGANYLRSGQWNVDGVTNPGADSYRVSMELVQYTL